MAEKKMTKREYFLQIREVVKDNADQVAFIDHELELLAKKNSGTSQTKVQKENVEVSKIIVDELSNIAKPVTITDLMATSEVIKNYVLENGKHLTNQKISALLKPLVENNTVVRTVDKKTTYFSVSA